MEEFYKTEVGKILAHGVHENNSSVGQIQSSVYLLRRDKANGSLTDVEFLEYMDIIEKALKKNQDAMDYIYSNIKRIQEESK